MKISAYGLDLEVPDETEYLAVDEDGAIWAYERPSVCLTSWIAPATCIRYLPQGHSAAPLWQESLMKVSSCS